MAKWKSEVPGRVDDWTPECDRAAAGLQIAQDATINASQPAELTGALGRLAAARARFGAAMLALDKKRRPTFYGLR